MTGKSAAALVRQHVRDLLEHSPAFQQLSDPERRGLARDMTKVATYLVGGERKTDLPGEVVIETGGGASRWVESVDFPGFVAGLIQGVFDAIVDATIQQMEAYARLVQSVASQVDEFVRHGGHTCPPQPCAACQAAAARREMIAGAAMKGLDAVRGIEGSHPTIRFRIEPRNPADGSRRPV